MKPSGDPSSHDKPCTLCGTARPVLVRCQIDDTGKWHFVCPGACWKSVSGGVEDARGSEGQFPQYKYGGMWKNKHADGPVSAKKPARVKKRQREERRARDMGEEKQTEQQGGDEDENGSFDSEHGLEKSEPASQPALMDTQNSEHSS